MSDTVPVMWENSIHDFNSQNIKKFYSNVDKFKEEFNKEFPLSNLEIHISRSSKKEAQSTIGDFIIKLHLHLKNGKKFISEAKNSNINLAFAEAVRDIRHETDLSDRQKHTKMGRHRAN